jgi:31-O-methyltransferase
MEILRGKLNHPDPPQLWYQLREVVEARTYLQHGVEVDPGALVLDVGANVGVAAAFFAVECGAVAVHCFEPVPRIYAQLCENIQSFSACIPHPYGISSRRGTRTLTFYPRDWAISGEHAEPAADRARLRTALLNLGVPEQEAEQRLDGRFVTQRVSCEVRSISDVLEEESIERVDLLKIDVEGSEREVLAGIQDADWPRIRQVVAEVHLGEEYSAQAIQTLEDRGFRVIVDQDPAMRGTAIEMLYALRRETKPRHRAGRGAN